jgi:hypothetical protein
MNAQDPEETAPSDVSEVDSEAPSIGDNTPSEVADRPKEIGGRGGLDPTRYGDWEKAGRCIDF